MSTTPGYHPVPTDPSSLTAPGAPDATMMSLHPEVLRCDPDIQQRLGLSEGYVREYAELLQEGHRLGTIVVFQAGLDYYLADGFHRVEAARRIDLGELPAEIRVGTKRDAVLYACGANRHGKTLTNEEKRRTVSRLLQDAEWGQWSDNAIAKHCGVAQSFVAKVRRSLHSEISETHPRTYTTRHGTVTTMDTARIGHGSSAAPLSAVPQELSELQREQPSATPSPSPSLLTVKTLALTMEPVIPDPHGELVAPAPTPLREEAMRDTLARLLDEARANLIHMREALGTLQETQGYRQLTAADGQPFASLHAFVTASPPNGLGFDCSGLAALVVTLHTMPAQLSHRHRTLLGLLTLPPSCTRQELAERIGLPTEAVRKALSRLGPTQDRRHSTR